MEEDRQGDLVPRIPHAVSSLIAVHRPDGLFVLSGLEPGLWCVWWHVGSQDWCLGRPILGAGVNRIPSGCDGGVDGAGIGTNL